MFVTECVVLWPIVCCADAPASARSAEGITAAWKESPHTLWLLAVVAVYLTAATAAAY
jgi:hypothetical protein